MKDDNCIFCKLAAGDIPTNTVYEDDTFRVIMDANPATFPKTTLQIFMKWMRK